MTENDTMQRLISDLVKRHANEVETALQQATRLPTALRMYVDTDGSTVRLTTEPVYDVPSIPLS